MPAVQEQGRSALTSYGYCAAVLVQNGSWDEVSGEAFLRKLLSMPIEEAKFNTVSSQQRHHQLQNNVSSATTHFAAAPVGAAAVSTVWQHRQVEAGGKRQAGRLLLPNSSTGNRHRRTAFFPGLQGVCASPPPAAFLQTCDGLRFSGQ